MYSVSENGEGAVGFDFDDAAGTGGGVVERGMVGQAAVYALFELGLNFFVAGRGRTAGEIGRGADNGASQLLEQFLAKSEMGYAHTDGVVGSWEVGSEGYGE